MVSPSAAVCSTTVDIPVVGGLNFKKFPLLSSSKVIANLNEFIPTIDVWYSPLSIEFPRLLVIPNPNEVEIETFVSVSIVPSASVVSVLVVTVVTVNGFCSKNIFSPFKKEWFVSAIKTSLSSKLLTFTDLFVDSKG